MLHHVQPHQRQDAVLAEIHRLLRPGGAPTGQDSLDLRSSHHDDIYARSIHSV
jgi:hypothetical protein